MKWKFAATVSLLVNAAAAQDVDLSRLQDNLAQLQRSFAQGDSAQPEDRDYAAGTRALNRGQYEEAVRHFNGVIDRKGAQTDGALYWKAYAQNRLGRRSEATATLAALRGRFPGSRWRDDGQALEIEIQAAQGHAPNPADAENEELKLIALNSLMQSDPDRAVPLIEKVLRGNQSPGVRDRALFVLSQSGSPHAREMMLDMALGKSNPDLQSASIRYIAMAGGSESRKDLSRIYSSTSDVNIKREIIRSYLISGDRQALLKAVQSESNHDLQREAIHVLAQSGGRDELWQLYKNESSADMRREIVESMVMCGGDSHLTEIARSDKDLGVRKAAIKTLALTGGGDRSFVEMYRAESDPALKRELIKGLFLQQNAKGLIELARAEKDPAMKREIVSQLALIHSKETTEYMMEVLK